MGQAEAGRARCRLHMAPNWRQGLAGGPLGQPVKPAEGPDCGQSKGEQTGGPFKGPSQGALRASLAPPAERPAPSSHGALAGAAAAAAAAAAANWIREMMIDCARLCATNQSSSNKLAAKPTTRSHTIAANPKRKRAFWPSMRRRQTQALALSGSRQLLMGG